jgi:hypothetical protein
VRTLLSESPTTKQGGPHGWPHSKYYRFAD